MNRASVLTGLVYGAMIGVVVAVGAMASAAAGENLAENPSAEQVDEAGQPVGWGHYENTPREWGTTDEEFYTGNRSAFLRITGFGDDDYAYAGLAVGRTSGYNSPDAIPVQPNTTYYFSFYIAGYGFKREITVSPWGFKADGSGRDRGIAGIKLLPVPEWTRYTGSFETTSETERVVLMFFVYGLRDRDVEEWATLYVDDVYLGTEESPGPIAGTGRARVQVPSPPEEVKGEGYIPLEPGTVRIWDANKNYPMKHYDFRAWSDRANWSPVPYGTTDYTFKGEAVLEGENFWISLHASPYDAVFLYAKMDAEGTPSRHNEIYRAWNTPDGWVNYGGGSQLNTILKNEPGELVVESEAITRTRKGWETTVTTTYRIVGGKQWVEIRPVRQASQQGMHGETRIIVAPEAGTDGGDWVDDSTKHPNGYTTRLPTHSKMLLDLAMDIDAIWVMTWPDPAKSRPNATDHHGGWWSGWQLIGEGEEPPVWTAPFSYFGDEKASVYIGTLVHGFWKYQKIDQTVKAGENITGNWRRVYTRTVHGSRWQPGKPWVPTYPGKWRLTGRIDDKYYTQEVRVTKDDITKDRFFFTAPAAGTLEYLIFYLYDRTDETPAEISTPMDIYREALGLVETGIGEREEVEERPMRVALFQNIPNPFNQWTEIRYVLPEARGVELGVWNVLGQKVVELVEGEQKAGGHVVRWDGKDGSGRGVSSGMYFYRMKAGAFMSTKRMVILK